MAPTTPSADNGEIVGLGVDVDALRAKISDLEAQEAAEEAELELLLANRQHLDNQLLGLHRLR